jgi:prepilin-type N-terminal cleavage/methylation domain-containing protein
MKKGFTLIELMIVVAIIAIIAAIAIPSLLRSRMAANQTAAAAACKAYAEAQEIYRRTDYDGDGVLEYAQRLKGANSLLEKVADEGDLALIDKVFANAEGDPGDVTPKAGYVFTVMTEQGESATGGARNYIANDNMTLGYGLSAAAGAYDGTGRDNFAINNNGTIFQKDFGNKDDAVHTTMFNPDTTWAAAE